MGPVASRTVLVDLANDRQISVISDQGVHLKIFAYRGSLGVSLTVKEATEVSDALLGAITEAAAKEG